VASKIVVLGLALKHAGPDLWLLIVFNVCQCAIKIMLSVHTVSKH